MNSTINNLISSMPEPSFCLKTGLEVLLAAPKGYLGYWAFRGLRAINFVRFKNLTPQACIAASIGVTVLQRSIEGIYLLGCKIIGSREHYTFSSFNPAGRIDRLRTKTWSLITQMEGVVKRTDRAFSHRLGIRSNEELLTVPQDELSAMERIKKVFWSSVRQTVVEIFPSQTSFTILSYMGVGLGAFASRRALITLTVLSLIVNLDAQNKKNMQRFEIEQQMDAFILKNIQEKDIVSPLTSLEDLKKATHINLRNYPHLNKEEWERILTLGSNLEVIQLDNSQLDRIKNFNVQIRKDIKVQIAPFDSKFTALWNEEHKELADGSIEIMENGKPQTRPIHRFVIEQFSILKYAFKLINKKGEIDKEKIATLSSKQKEELGTLLSLIYTGECPLYLLNSLMYSLKKREVIFPNSKTSDVNLICKKDEKETNFAAHKALLALHFPQFKEKLNSDVKEIEIPEDPEAVLLALKLAYKSSLDWNEIKNEKTLDQLLSFSERWQLNYLMNFVVNAMQERGNLTRDLAEIKSLLKIANTYSLEMLQSSLEIKKSHLEALIEIKKCNLKVE